MDKYTKMQLDKVASSLESSASNAESAAKAAEKDDMKFVDNVPKSGKIPKTLEEASAASREVEASDMDLLKETMTTESQIATEKSRSEFIASKNDEWYSKVNDSITSNDIKTTTELLKEKKR